MEEKDIYSIFGIDENRESLKSNVFLSQQDFSSDNSPEDTVRTIAKILLWLGITAVAFVILFGSSRIMGGDYLPAILISIGFALSNVVVWALLMVFTNISNTLKEINSKLK